MLEYQSNNLGNGFYFRCRSATGYSWHPHIHEYTELMYVKSGTCTMYIDGKLLSVPEGKAVFIFPNQIHEYTAKTESTIWWCVFSNDFLNCFYIHHPGSIPREPVVDMQKNSRVINALMDADVKNATLLTGLLHLMFYELEQSTEFEQKTIVGNTLYHLCISYIAKNFRSELTLSDMAKELGYHEKYLSSTLHSLTKMNFCTFLSTYRVDHAKKLLKSTDMSISEIALDSGFAYASTFNKVFKKLTGVTPMEYKRGQGI